MKFFTTTALLLIAHSLFSQIHGCTDSQATNFNVNATQNDGSCVYAAATIVPQSSFVLASEIDETSGLILFDNVLLTHIDDGDAKLHQLDLTNGTTISTIQIPHASNIDWEDIAQDDTYIYVGDFGNNATGIRTNLRIFRFPKSEWENPITIDTIRFSYSSQTDFSTSSANATNFDCEAFIVTSEKIYLFTKEWNSNATSVYELEKIPGNHIANYQNSFNVGGLITGATHLEEKQLLVLAGYTNSLSPFLYLLYDFNGANFFSGNKRKINLNLPFHQVEGITSVDGINYYVSNEKISQNIISVDQKLHLIDLSNYLNDYLNPEFMFAEFQTNHSQFSVSPNPFSDNVVIKSNQLLGDEIVRVELYDLTGKVLFASKLNAAVQQFDFSNLKLNSGVYQLVFRSSTGRGNYVYSLVKE